MVANHNTEKLFAPVVLIVAAVRMADAIRVVGRPRPLVLKIADTAGMELATGILETTQPLAVRTALVPMILPATKKAELVK
jgi:hypothetical protein